MLNCPNCTAPLTVQTAHCPSCGVSLQTTAIPHTWSQRAAPDDQLRVDDLLYGSDLYPRAGFFPRIVAHIIDSIVLALLFAPIILVTNTMRGYGDDSAAFSALLFFLLLLIPLTYFLAKDGLFRGRSLGKMAMGLMVIDVAQGTPCHVGKAIGRNLMSCILLVLPLGGFVDLILILTDAEGRRLGDRICRTQVIPQSAYHLR